MTEASVPGELLDKVKEAAADGRLDCPAARRLAEDMGVSYKLIGEACNELDIKIKDCALGCF